MKPLHVVDSAGSVGYVSPSDRRGFELNPLAWTAMNSVRMDEGAVEPAWGYDGGVLALDDSVHSLDYMVNRNITENYYIIGSDSKIECVYINPADASQMAKRDLGTGYLGDYDSGDTWVTTLKDGHLVMTNGVDAPQMVLRDDVDSVVAAPLTGFTDAPAVGTQPAYTTCKTIIAFRGFLVAGNLDFLGEDPKPDMIAWSDRTDTGSLPASWDYTDPATLAGNFSMPGNYGSIIALELIRDELMIYCERGAYRMQWVGGQYVFRIVPAFDTVGALNPRSTCSNKGTNIIVSHTDIVRSDGQYPVSIANGTVRKELFDQLGPSNSHLVQVIEYPAQHEIIIICPDKQDDEWSGKVLAWNWHTETWSVRHGLLMRCMNTVPKLVSSLDPDNFHANSTYDDIYRWGEGIEDGVTEPPLDEQYDDINDQIVTQDIGGPLDNYSLINATYGTLLEDGGVLYLFGIATKADKYAPSEPIAASNSLWQFDFLIHSYLENPSVWERPYVERRGINLGNDETVQMVTAVYPRMEGSGAINVRIGAVDYIGGSVSDVRWDPPVLFNPEEDYRVTCRVAGRRHAIKFEAVPEQDASGADQGKFQDFRLTGYDMEFSNVGRR